jgi:hypothetical protein
VASAVLVVASAALLATGLAGSGATLLFVASGLALLAVILVALEMAFGHTPSQESTLDDAAGPVPADSGTDEVLEDDEVFEETGESESPGPDPPASPPPGPE